MSTKPYRWMMVEPGRPMVRTEFELGELAADQVVVEVAGCGVCHTDLGYYYDGVRTNQPLPLALGHEISGRVVGAGSAAGQWVGRAVIVPAARSRSMYTSRKVEVRPRLIAAPFCSLTAAR